MWQDRVLNPGPLALKSDALLWPLGPYKKIRSTSITAAPSN